MHFPTHLAISWLVAHRLPELKDRRIVALAGVAPDIDGISIIGGIETYAKWHHVLGHGVLMALLTGIFAFALAKERWKVLLLALCTFHLHLLCDLIGTRWGGMAYFWPFSQSKFSGLGWWVLDSWQNFTITAVVFVCCLWIGIKQGNTFLEVLLPKKADQKFIEILRREKNKV